MSGLEMDQTIAQLVVPGKGILAADESAGTIAKRLASVDVESTEETRRSYRSMLFTTPGLSEFISGVILFEETLQQKSDTEIPIPRLLAEQGIVPGIKVDKGTVALAHFPGDKITQGLDGLADRLAGYKELGAKFAKWRAVITIGEDLPSTRAIEANADTLARYAAICQEAGVVPIVEPEVLMDGDHTMECCEYVTQEVLETVFHALHRHRVILERMLLKPSMVVPGKDCAVQASPEQVAAATLAVLRRTVPAAMPGIKFLSGGQSDRAASANLNALNTAPGVHPWQLSFSYGRALQSAALKAWRGKPENKAACQQALHQRARANSAAQQGTYTIEMEG